MAHDIPYHDGDAQTEVLTPTGAALIAAIAKEYVDTYDGFVSQNQGVGFGSRDLGKIPNMMRIVIGEVVVGEDETPGPPPKETAKKSSATGNQNPKALTSKSN